MSKNVQTHIFLFIANLIYGVSFSIAKDVVPHYIGPYSTILIRVSGALLLFILTYSIFIREKIKKEDIPLMVACGFFGVAINQLLFFKGLSITTPINAALIMVVTPIMVVVISAIMGRDYINWQRILGIGLGICGAITIIAFGKSIEFIPGRELGDLCIFLNACAYAVYIVIVKPLMHKYNPVTVITFVFLFGWFFVLPAGYSQFAVIDWRNMPTTIALELSFIVLGTTFFAYLLNILALRNASPSIVGIYIYSQPAIASVFALIMNKDVFSWEKLIATVLIFVGVYLVSFGGKEKATVAE